MCWRSKLEKWRFTIGANAMERFYSHELSSPRSSCILRRHLDFLWVLSNGSPSLTVLYAFHHETSRRRYEGIKITPTKFLIIIYFFYSVKLKIKHLICSGRPPAINAPNCLLYINNIFLQQVKRCRLTARWFKFLRQSFPHFTSYKMFYFCGCCKLVDHAEKSVRIMVTD